MRKYTDSELRHLQIVELEILKEVIRVCEENQITYFTVGGTTLGAIRHNGFIPWDDDIDIGMMREDYERFLKIAPSALNKGYDLTYYYTDPNSPTYYAKVRKEGTEFVEPYTKDIDMNHGIFIDIMPYDFSPNNHIKRKLHDLHIKFWNQLYIAKTVKTVSMIDTKHKGMVKIARRVNNVIASLFSKRFLYEQTTRAMSMVTKEKKCVTSRGLPHFESFYSDVFPPIKHDFEDIQVMIPCNYKKLLTIQYGDYMKLPPIEKRYGHAPVVLKF